MEGGSLHLYDDERWFDQVDELKLCRDCGVSVVCFAYARHRKFHSSDTERFNRDAARFDIIHKIIQIAVFIDVNSVGRRKIRQVDLAINDMFHIERERLIDW